MHASKRWTTSLWVKAPQPRLGSIAPALGRPKVEQSQNEPPIVLVRTVAARQIIVAANESAALQSIRPGMTLAEARAICAHVRHGEHDPHRDAVALEALARWMMRFSPAVAICSSAEHPLSHHSSDRHDEAYPAEYGLYLDVTGCERLFQGLENLITRFLASLKRLHIAAAIAVAPTPGAAWALTFSPQHQGKIVSQEQLLSALGPLPPWALRIDAEIVRSLHHLGLETIEQIEKLPRDLLPARFGPQLLLRLDQALGRVSEPLAWLEPATPIAAQMDFEAPVHSLESIWLVFKKLIDQVIPELARRGRGARELALTFFRPYEPPIHHTIRLSRASRDPVKWFNLMRVALEGVQEEARSHEVTKARRKEMHRRLALRAYDYDRYVPSGFIGIWLEVKVSERISEEQITLLEQEQFNGAIELSHLIERLRVRAGDNVIGQVELAESHIPEQAFRARMVSSVCQPRKRGALSRREKGGDIQRFLPHPVRPLRLLRRPEEIRVIVSPSDDLDGRPVSFTTSAGEVHRLAHIIGPERLAGQWWTGHNKTRDYFNVEDSTGKRFWIFRVLQTARWYLHGFFV